jgi:hypothetical protein
VGQARHAVLQVEPGRAEGAEVRGDLPRDGLGRADEQRPVRRALLAGSKHALASCPQVAAGDDRWLLTTVRGHLGDTRPKCVGQVLSGVAPPHDRPPGADLHGSGVRPSEPREKTDGTTQSAVLACGT